VNRLHSIFKQLTFTEKSAPLGFFILCLLGYGLMIPSLGFYMDDWPYVFYAFNKGIPSLKEMLIYDSRPNAAWLYMLAFQVLGFRPLTWHIWALIMHWGTMVIFWLVMREMWPERRREGVIVAGLFGVYPFFMLQPFAVGSTHHWFGFLGFNLSLYLMIRAYRTTGIRMVLLTLTALVIEAAHLFTSEYFAGLELIRPVLLWILAARTLRNFSATMTQVLLRWIPFLILLTIFAYWRAAIYENPEEITRNTPVVVEQLLEEPWNAVTFLSNAALKDGLSVLTIGWQKATDVETLNLGSSFVLFRIGIVGITFLLSWIYLSNYQSFETAARDGWRYGSPALAFFALLTGGLPVWLIGRTILESKNLLSASRFGIPATFGAALTIFLLADWIVTERNRRLLLYSILIALSVNFHLDNAKGFQYSWEKQVRFAKELLWRAPQIEAGTALFTDEEILGVMGEYAVSFSIITTYQPGDIDSPPYWYFPFYYTYPNLDELLMGTPLEYRKLTMNFKGDSRNMLVLSFNPEMKRCLWVLQPQDVRLRLVSDDMRKLSQGSRIERIISAEGVEPSLPEPIYGKTENQGWCYYFEKADLARQYGQWDEIARLWEESQAIGERADNGFEYIPFIEGFGHLGDWEQVNSLTRTANRITSGLEPSLCSALDRLLISTPADIQRDETINELNAHLVCDSLR